MNVLNWIGDHPVLTMLALLIVCSTAETIAETIWRRR